MKNIKTSKGFMAIIDAVEKGYRPTQSGDVVSPRGKVLATRKVGGGRRYPAFSYTFEGKRIAIRVSSFICYFYNKPGYSKKGSVARHLNDNPNDNRPVNIAAGTRSENEADKKINKLRKIAVEMVAQDMEKRGHWIAVQEHPFLKGFAICV
jgi:hypothetical protein